MLPCMNQYRLRQGSEGLVGFTLFLKQKPKAIRGRHLFRIELVHRFRICTRQKYMHVIWTSFGHHLGSFREHLGIIWASFGYHLAIIWESFRDHLDIVWASFGNYLRISWRLFADHMEVILG